MTAAQHHTHRWGVFQPLCSALSVVVRRLFRTRSISCRFEGVFLYIQKPPTALYTARDLTSSVTETVDGIPNVNSGEGSICFLTSLFRNHFNSLVNKTIAIGSISSAFILGIH